MQAAYTKIDEGRTFVQDGSQHRIFMLALYSDVYLRTLRREKRVTVKACGGVASDIMGR
jgi:hypothetical protein